MNKKRFLGRFILLAGLSVMLLAAAPAAQQDQIERARIFRETYNLIMDSDYYCSFFILDLAEPGLKIIGAENADKILLGDAEVVYLNMGSQAGINEGDLFLVLEVGGDVNHPRTMDKFGPLCHRRGRARVFYIEEDKAAARLEKTCGQVKVGFSLVPFEEREGIEGKDEGYVPYQSEKELLKGEVIFLRDELRQIGTGGWALIDIGQDEGLHAGQQLTVFKKIEKDKPRRNIGNAVVIDVQQGTATIKILSCQDVVVLGDGVEVK